MIMDPNVIVEDTTLATRQYTTIATIINASILLTCHG